MTIEVRERRFSADLRGILDDTKPWSPGTMLTQYRVVKDGKIVDSFSTRARAEAKAKQLRQAEAKG